MADVVGSPGGCRDRGGPLVTVCGGHRCEALWRMAADAAASGDDPTDHLGPNRLGQTIERTPGGVLVRSDCLGLCHQAPVITVAYRDSGSRHARFGLAFASVNRSPVLRGLLRWIGGIASPRDLVALPHAVRAAVIRPGAD